MPKRSNEFQQLVYLIKKLTSEHGVVTESKLLTDRLTGQAREVDVVVETKVADTPVCISFECRDHKRLADVVWVEQAKAKHQNLPTSALVLVSRKGFTKAARKRAEVENIQLLTYRDASEEAVSGALSLNLDAWGVSYALSVTKVVAVTEAVPLLASERVALGPENYVYDEAGEQLCTAKDLAGLLLRDERFTNYLATEGRAEHRHFSAECTFSPRRFMLQKIDPSVQVRIVSLDVFGTTQISRERFLIQRGSLGSVRFTWGAASLGGRRAILVGVERQPNTMTFQLSVNESSEAPDLANSGSTFSKVR